MKKKLVTRSADSTFVEAYFWLKLMKDFSAVMGRLEMQTWFLQP